MKGLNLSGFKKIKEDARSATMIHKDGHQIIVAKSGLKPIQVSQLEKLPIHMYGAGIVQDPDGDAPPNPNPPPQSDNQPTKDGAPEPSALPAPSPTSGVTGSWDDVPQNQTSNTQDTQQSASSAAPDINKGLQDQISGIKALANAEGNQGNQVASAIDKSNQEIAELPSSQQVMEKYWTADDAYKQYINRHDIDPNHFWVDKGTGQKIAAGIGLFLGGLSSPFTGQGNPALGIINKAIENDIDAQKSNLGKVRTLWSMNRDAMKDDLAANLATRNQAYVNLQQQIQKIAATNQSPIAQAKAQQLISVVQQQMDQNNFKRSLMSGPTADNADPSTRVQFLVPKEQQKEAFKEIQDRTNANKIEPAMMDNFDKAAKENTILRTGAGMLRTPTSILNLRAMALPMIHDAEGRVNEFEAKTLHDLEPAPGDTDAKIAEKRVGMQQFMQQKRAAPVNKGFGNDLDRFPSTANMAITPAPQNKPPVLQNGHLYHWNPKTNGYE